ncbi:MAG: hypothetical protein F4Y68_06835 [Boseongicola sp. SB0665_bin_10]|nr:hypothetical protein [Boseongicola sp. SB0665_bin_10]
MAETLDYGSLMHRAMRGLFQEVLREVAANGLPGKHHFFISFDTSHPDARMADWLQERHPKEMTIVIQNWFENLEVTDDGFSVTLNFGNAPEPLYIPFDSLLTFVDPSVEFGIRFETGEEESAPVPIELEPDGKQESEAEIVKLDNFRK